MEAHGLINYLQHHGQLSLLSFSNKSEVNISDDLYQSLHSPHRSVAYTLLFVKSGAVCYEVDFEKKVICCGQLLFITPHQVRIPPSPNNIQASEWYKVIFDGQLLSLLPQSYSFLRNPFSNSIIPFDEVSQHRLVSIFSNLEQLLNDNQDEKSTQIILGYLHTLLTELNHQYYKRQQHHSQHKKHLQNYIDFREVIENSYREQPATSAMADRLAISDSRLHRVVTQHAGKSPKQYLNDRVILEAKRMLFYDDILTKELAYVLGFNDHHYFSRFFKEQTGKTVT